MKKFWRIICGIAAALFCLCICYSIAEKGLIMPFMGKLEFKCFGNIITGSQLIYALCATGFWLALLAIFSKKPLYLLAAPALFLAGAFIVFYLIPVVESQLPAKILFSGQASFYSVLATIGLTLIMFILGIAGLTVGILMPLTLIVSSFQK
jgi:hypothetical protein